MASETKTTKSEPRAWTSLGFPDWSRDAVSAMGFARATPVQASMPSALNSSGQIFILILIGVWPLMGTGNKDVVRDPLDLVLHCVGCAPVHKHQRLTISGGRGGNRQWQDACFFDPSSTSHTPPRGADEKAPHSRYSDCTHS